MHPFAIYFPQYYPTPTNDENWGRGFTDWALIANANLRSWWERRAPEQGYYDGSSREVHEAQIRTAIDHGLGGFAVYHYWFYSHQELPAFEQTLLARASDPRFSWFAIWASEGWSRRWMGDPTSIVDLDPEPSAEAIEAHCEHLARCFERPDYLRIDGRPLFVWYHLSHFKHPREIVRSYRQALERRGHRILTGQFVKNPADAALSDATDVTYVFEPRFYFGTKRVGRGTLARRVLRAMERVLGEAMSRRLLTLLDRFQQRGTTFEAADYESYLASPERRDRLRAIPGIVQQVVSPGWNNTPRYGDRFTRLDPLSAESFGRALRSAMSEKRVPALVNAWNEWSEGAAIEPCAYLGTRYLDALSSVVRTGEDLR